VRARIWGCRGSLATPGPETLRYGGNTSCVQVTLDDGTCVILDAGTGIRELGLEVAKDHGRPIHVCLTHLHLDHIEGFGFFAPIWQPGSEVHVWGPPSATRSLEERIARYLSAPLFPVELVEIPANLFFHDAPTEPWEIGGARVTAARVSHPGATLGYRVEGNGSALAYIPDHEPALGVELGRLTSDWVSGFPIAAGASVLLHDAQYTEDEYPTRVGWGHSSIADMVSFAMVAKVQRLFMFHHDPLHSDGQLEAMLLRSRELWGQDRDGLALSFEGMEIDVS
jgi:phosphoribosyl 1,2-cyclic phosphodiesterase